ncbi:MAG: hypothetical protein AB7P04_02930 [Bacteriovoracia bacterium]
MTGRRFLFMTSAIGVVLTAQGGAHAADPISYATRSHPYSGWGNTIRGDIRSIGMAGATFGLADTFIGSLENPAGLAMTLPNSGLQASGNLLYDGNVQNYDESVSSSILIAGINAYPAGFSFSYWTPNREGQPYTLTTGETIQPAVSASEFRLSAARTLAQDRFALGISLVLGKGNRTLVYPDRGNIESSATDYRLGVVIGALYQFPRRWLLGLTYASAMTYQSSNRTDLTHGIDQFYQDILVPHRVGIGAGWIPNRFFRFGFGFAVTGPISGATLLRDDQTPVGDGVTVQPRLGAHYLFVDYAEFNAALSLGSYLEPSRVAGARTRVHGTVGIEINPWIFNLGWALDKSTRYSNYIFSVGLDVIKAMTKLDLVPEAWKPSHAGFFPSPSRLSETGLPRPLVRNWDERMNAPDIIQVSKELPKKLEEKFNDLLGDEKPEADKKFETPPKPPAKPKRTKKKPRVKKKKKT